MTNFNNQKSERVFVTKIPKSFEAEQVQSYFETFGEVTDFHMPKNPRSGYPGHKGIAFVSFADSDIAEKVREMNTHFLDNHRIVCDHATARNHAVSAQRKAETKALFRAESRGKCQVQEYLEYAFGVTDLSSMNGGYPVDEATCEQWMKSEGAAQPQYEMMSEGAAQPQYESNRVFVTKISEDISKENVCEYFSQFGALEDCYMPGSSGKTHKGIAFVSFRDVALANFVLKRGSYEIKPGQFIVVDKANARSNGAKTEGRVRRNGFGGQRNNMRSSPY